MTVKNVRLVKSGDIIALDEDRQEVVREVLVVVRYSNGETVNYEPTQTVDVLPPEDLSEVASQLEEESTE